MEQSGGHLYAHIGHGHPEHQRERQCRVLPGEIPSVTDIEESEAATMAIVLGGSDGKGR